MRIRKNAKLSSILYSHASTPESLQTHVCQLNQSPWDVISFSQETYPSFNPQLEGEDSFTGNGSFGDSIGAVESVASMMDGEEKAVMFKVEDMIIDDNGMEDNEETKMEDKFGFEKEYKTLYCIKTDGKGWQCRNEAKDGYTMCDHHLSLTKSYGNNTSSFSKKPDKGIAVRRGRARAKKGSSSSSNPYEFYYYSGFGPLWGKRRGDKVNEGKKVEDREVEDMNQQSKTPSSSQIEDIDFVDDEDDEDDENGDSGKKRMRKPVKARSLKSLM
ncbi:hypothetical protein Patl1_00481 [Pistacia atlantica]|uniref:Uncharacterized protein n=1 Tax=Pistacia atlantica TaxID=434234 RepID=A0ACC1C4D7_9ROSI|nr:hypothetical protein Patl1_00481 [Pistacia atlantica]